jgi:hypothetical protein
MPNGRRECRRQGARGTNICDSGEYASKITNLSSLPGAERGSRSRRNRGRCRSTQAIRSTRQDRQDRVNREIDGGTRCVY